MLGGEAPFAAGSSHRWQEARAESRLTWAGLIEVVEDKLDSRDGVAAKDLLH